MLILINVYFIQNLRMSLIEMLPYIYIYIITECQLCRRARHAQRFALFGTPIFYNV